MCSLSRMFSTKLLFLFVSMCSCQMIAAVIKKGHENWFAISMISEILQFVVPVLYFSVSGIHIPDPSLPHDIHNILCDTPFSKHVMIIDWLFLKIEERIFNNIFHFITIQIIAIHFDKLQTAIFQISLK
jgi:hypothetical protein